MSDVRTVLPEMELSISQLERGTVVTKFNHRKKPEKKTLMIRRETKQIVWQKTSKGLVDGTVDFREIRDVKGGKNSKDFEKWPDDAKKYENSKCFVIFYGSEFRLQTVSIAALSEKECELWMRTIKYLVVETREANYTVQLETWLRKQFYSYSVDSSSHPSVKGTINLKELKAFLPKINCKLSTGKLRDIFSEYDVKKTGEIGFDDFSMLFHRLLHDSQILTNYFEKYKRDGHVYLDQLTAFLREEQTDLNVQPQDIITNFQDNNRTGLSYITEEEFLDYLYGQHNSIWDENQDKVSQDMTRPLSHYYIASSHNTYLTGDQFSSESSTEAYIRCLLSSCRCVELDCWDGSLGEPFIFHGHTLTSKIRFSDVCRVIREYAFVSSDYPLILSIEDHCTLAQQRKMAQLFQEIFGESLIVSQLNKNETCLPSPEQLKYKIILKHKKLPPEGTVEEEQIDEIIKAKDMDLSNTIKNGVMYIEDENSRWQQHFFVLTKRKLLYTEMNQTDSQSDQSKTTNQEETTLKVDDSAADCLHFSEKWFHGRLKGGRSAAVQLISNYKKVDGTFLVRESETFVGDYTLSAWRKGRVIHCHIHSKYEWGQVKYYLVDSLLFDSLYSLILYYRENPIRAMEFHVKLGDPVPQPSNHEDKPWFHKIDRAAAEDSLKRTRMDGAFLVRPSSNSDYMSYVISFRAKNKIKHCVIKEDGRLFTVGQNKFETLVDLISYYQKNPFYLGVKLKYPLTDDLLRDEAAYFDNLEDQQVYTDYLDTNDVFKNSSENNVTARALYDYNARRDDELSFKKNDVIVNIMKEDEGWWKGEKNGILGWFPSNHVVLIEDNCSILGDLQKGCIDLTSAFVELKYIQGDPQFPWRVCIMSSDGNLNCFAVEREDCGNSWVQALLQVGESVSERETENKKMERVNRIAKELSSLIVYCCSVNKFSLEKIKKNGRIFQEMSSFPETTAEKLFSSERSFFFWYHEVQLSRVYPKGQRLDSSNYNPIPFWSVGCQLVALNYQTPDKALQLNQAKFRQNGGCGYILRPDFMFSSENYYEPEPINYELTIIGGRHLWKSGRGIISPFVEVEVTGGDIKLSNFSHIFKTRTIQDNGLNPNWNETFKFSILWPECTLLRLVVYDEDMFGDPNFVGQASYPMNCLKFGYRSVQLRNGYSEEIELACLLVHFRRIP